ncbi:type II toxin-antitoxin system VapC family toxin [Chitinophaga cymbidii]|uniref:Twitching motility protein PilT n=1 Tax=Chitinophaga cymbidii TaxID=1096750 RepID=A0A512RPV5_9BACT|nr:type II toxin-antitoxin system VapC family toxin [Chitinophaga cymbidii]GEP97717.1 twitching motility protein PilT [Chitinophaga cymbidii]
MSQYLIDTNICIFFMKGLYNLQSKFQEAGNENCIISEITLAELKFGVENSQQKERNSIALDNFLTGVTIIPIFSCFDIYAKEKARLRKLGQPVDDFDLLIGSTAVANDLIMVTNNAAHLGRVQGIRIEDWTK